jgi:hypothetical protein
MTTSIPASALATCFNQNCIGWIASPLLKSLTSNWPLRKGWKKNESSTLKKGKKKKRKNERRRRLRIENFLFNFFQLLLFRRISLLMMTNNSLVQNASYFTPLFYLFFSSQKIGWPAYVLLYYILLYNVGNTKVNLLSIFQSFAYCMKSL